MKILITGVTDTHINKVDRAKSTKFISIPELITKTLRQMGHTVAHKEVHVGDDLSEFDKVICFLYPLDKHARHPWAALYTLDVRSDAIIAVDDWSCHNVQSTWSDLVGTLSDRLWIAPIFKWGNVSKLGINAEIVTYDPSPAVELDAVEIAHPKINTWLHASFHPSSHFWAAQATSWPVLSYGCKPLLQPRILESEVIRLHGQVRGSLIPPYQHVGSGWWRVRVLHAINAECVIGADPREFCGMSLGLHPRDIEHLSSESLDELAFKQATAIRSQLGTMDEMQSILTKVLEAA